MRLWNKEGEFPNISMILWCHWMSLNVVRNYYNKDSMILTIMPFMVKSKSVGIPGF